MKTVSGLRRNESAREGGTIAAGGVDRGVCTLRRHPIIHEGELWTERVSNTRHRAWCIVIFRAPRLSFNFNNLHAMRHLGATLSLAMPLVFKDLSALPLFLAFLLLSAAKCPILADSAQRKPFVFIKPFEFFAFLSISHLFSVTHRLGWASLVFIAYLQAKSYAYTD